MFPYVPFNWSKGEQLGIKWTKGFKVNVPLFPLFPKKTLHDEFSLWPNYIHMIIVVLYFSETWEQRERCYLNLRATKPNSVPNPGNIREQKQNDGNRRIKMNNYAIEVKQWTSCAKATEGVNEFIADCNEKGIEIIETTSHVTEIEDFMTYVFIFKFHGLV